MPPSADGHLRHPSVGGLGSRTVPLRARTPGWEPPGVLGVHGVRRRRRDHTDLRRVPSVCDACRQQPVRLGPIALPRGVLGRGQPYGPSHLYGEVGAICPLGLVGSCAGRGGDACPSEHRLRRTGADRYAWGRAGTSTAPGGAGCIGCPYWPTWVGPLAAPACSATSTAPDAAGPGSVPACGWSVSGALALAWVALRVVVLAAWHAGLMTPRWQADDDWAEAGIWLVSMSAVGVGAVWEPLGDRARAAKEWLRALRSLWRLRRLWRGSVASQPDVTLAGAPWTLRPVRLGLVRCIVEIRDCLREVELSVSGQVLAAIERQVASADCASRRDADAFGDGRRAAVVDERAAGARGGRVPPASRGRP